MHVLLADHRMCVCVCAHVCLRVKARLFNLKSCGLADRMVDV